VSLSGFNASAGLKVNPFSLLGEYQAAGYHTAGVSGNPLEWDADQVTTFSAQQVKYPTLFYTHRSSTPTAHQRSPTLTNAHQRSPLTLRRQRSRPAFATLAVVSQMGNRLPPSATS
jgi:hypothetical protein